MDMSTTITATEATSTGMVTDLRLARLLQLASPALPVGAYSYSQGLESAVEAGIVRDAASAGRWIGDVLELSLARLEAPLVARMIADPSACQRWNAWFVASRETAELRAETLQMGYSLASLLGQLGVAPVPVETPAFPTAYAWAASQWGIEPGPALTAYLWSWAENQTMAAIKAVPLGQTDGQRILFALGARIANLAGEAIAREDAALTNFTPGLALLSSRHETQYSRLFRS